MNDDVQKSILTVVVFLLSLLGGAQALAPEQKFGAGASNFGQPFTIVSTTSTQPATTTRIFGNTSPQSNNQFDLGEPDFSWRNVYASSTGYFSNIVAGGGATSFAGGGVTARSFSATSTGVGFAASGTIAIAGTATSTFAGAVSSTQSILGDGVADNLALYFGNDTDTGFYRFSSGYIRFVSNGSATFDLASGALTAQATLSASPDASRNNGTAGARWNNGWFGGTVTSTRTDVNTGTTATSTIFLGDSDSPSCFILGDSDGAGITYLTVLNGVASFSTTDCRT